MLFSRRNVNMAVDVDFISMSRIGQLAGFCNALPNIWKLREHTCATLKRNTHVLFSSPAYSILASELDLICLARNSHFTGFCNALSKMVKRMTCTKIRNTRTQEHRNTLEHSGTPQSTPNPGTAKKTRNTEFDDVVLISHYRPCKKIKCQCNLFTHVTWKSLGSGS